jgi:D-tyrosyl-tRNA(Tyr) deacylase
MTGLIQRVSQAEVWVADKCVSKIGRGILLFVGMAHDDGQSDIQYIARKSVHLRIFGDEQGQLDRSLIDIAGELLVVSQFTLLGDTRKGRRPSFTNAAAPDVAEQLYQQLIEEIRGYGVLVKRGVFRARMDIRLTNEGPVTIIVDTKDKKG